MDASVAFKWFVEEPGSAEARRMAEDYGRRLEALFLVDEREASATAVVFGVRPLGTVGVLLQGLSEGFLSFDGFVGCLDQLVESGFWLSVDVTGGRWPRRGS